MVLDDMIIMAVLSALHVREQENKMKRTALKRLEELSALAYDNARAHMHKGNTKSELYNEGKVAAYNHAYLLMKEELKRLRNMWQNGMIHSTDDFNIGD